MAVENIRVAIITISDRVAAGSAADRSGPALADAVSRVHAADSNIDWSVVGTTVVPDDPDRIRSAICRFTDADQSTIHADVVVTTGGTGFSPRDSTPETVLSIIDRHAPGLTHLMLSTSLRHTPMAALSRPVCGIRNHSIILTVPGSPKGAVECFQAVVDHNVLAHAVDLLRNQPGAGESLHQSMHSQPPTTQTDPNHTCCHIKTGSSGPATLSPRESPFELTSLSNAINMVLMHTQRLPSKPILLREIRTSNLSSLVGHVLANSVVAKHPVPAFRASIVDGYAVVSSDGPGEYPVTYVSLAGDDAPAPNTSSTQHESVSGRIVRITTGAPVPHGFDAVVMVEDTTIIEKTQTNQESIVRINFRSRPGMNIREIGSDTQIGDTVLHANTVLSANGSEIGALLSTLCSDTNELNPAIHVIRKPIVAVISTGNELMDPLESHISFSNNSSHQLGKIWDTNRPSILSCLQASGYHVMDLGIVADTVHEISNALIEALEHADVIITTGGVSMGETDHIKPILKELYGIIKFGRINIKPGKPTTFAIVPKPQRKSLEPIENRLVFGLPGNPVSALVMLHMLVILCLRKMSGHLPIQTTFPQTQTHNPDQAAPRHPYMPSVQAVLYQDIQMDTRPQLVRVTLHPPYTYLHADQIYRPLHAIQNGYNIDWAAVPVSGHQRSSRLQSMVQVTGLAYIMSSQSKSTDESCVRAGNHVTVYLIDNPFY